MIEQEFYTVKEVSLNTNTSPRNVRKIAGKLRASDEQNMLFKDGLNGWRIHRTLLPYFKRKRKRPSHNNN